jgi:hypothetical protein
MPTLGARIAARLGKPGGSVRLANRPLLWSLGVLLLALGPRASLPYGLG